MSEPLTSLIHIDRTVSQGVVQQLINELRRLISEGHLSAGFILPSSRSLSNQLGVSRNTVTYAIEQLVAEGYIAVSQGRRPHVLLQSALFDQRRKTTDPNTGNDTPTLKTSILELDRSIWPTAIAEPMKPLRQGRADSREFPHDVWARCLRRAARNKAGFDDTSLNRRSLQNALRSHLVQHRGIAASPEQILFVPTAQAGLNLIADIVLAPGDIAWMESPGYSGARAAIETNGGHAIGIELDENGMVIDGQDAAQPKLIFTTPTHQFPTGRLMSVNRRLELLALAESKAAWIIEDDYDGEFHFDDRPVPALQGLDHSNRVFYLGTFSKTTFSDIRLGYIVVPKQVLESFKLAQMRGGLLASIQTQEALAEFISEGHFIAHIRKAKRLYQERRDHLVDLLEREVGNYFDVEKPPGGMQLVAWCRKKMNDRTLVALLADAGVVARPVSELFVSRTATSGLVLGFAAWRQLEIESAVRTLRGIVTQPPSDSFAIPVPEFTALVE